MTVNSTDPVVAFESGLQRLTETRSYFALLSEIHDLETASVINRIIGNIVMLARRDFPGLAVVDAVTTRLGANLSMDEEYSSMPILKFAVQQAGGELRVPAAAIAELARSPALSLGINGEHIEIRAQKP